MTPDDFAARHPLLYHLTAPEAVSGIRARGLLTAAQAIATHAPDRPELARHRPAHVPLPGGVTLGDHGPLNETRLAACLDDGLTPADWIAMLNDRVFFYVDPGRWQSFVASRRKKGQDTTVLTFDAAPLLAAHRACAEITPFNTGATVHVPPRRGRGTFAPLDGLDWERWRRVRGRASPDTVKEVAIRGGVPDAGAYLLEVRPA
jgi:hypothetical protein